MQISLLVTLNTLFICLHVKGDEFCPWKLMDILAIISVRCKAGLVFVLSVHVLRVYVIHMVIKYILYSYLLGRWPFLRILKCRFQKRSAKGVYTCNEQLLNVLCRLSLMYLVSWSSLLCLSYNIMELQARGS